MVAELSSKDVIHDFFLPAMRIAGDAIPGSLIPIWFTPVKTGSYEVICAQLCGLGHYGMKGTLVVDTPQDYQAWLKERAELSGTQTAPPPPTQRPAGEPPSGSTPGTIPPPGAPKPLNAGERGPGPSPAQGGQSAPSGSPSPTSAVAASLLAAP
jgi:cytochrome c oxidase subunit 2